jgi:dihydropyrimidinase
MISCRRRLLLQVLQKAAKIGALVGVHAENRDVNNVLVKQYLAEGKTDAWWHYMSKNEDVEGEADVRAINLAKMAGTSLYIVHWLTSRVWKR